MYWQTLPNWFWVIYYLFLFLTLLAGIFSITLRNLKFSSILSIILTITIPIFSLINSIGREEGIDEFEYLLNQLQLCSPWALYVFIGYLYLFIWWIIFFIKLIKEKNK